MAVIFCQNDSVAPGLGAAGRWLRAGGRGRDSLGWLERAAGGAGAGVGATGPPAGAAAAVGGRGREAVRSGGPSPPGLTTVVFGCYHN
jgi:hypothetical protein